VILQYEPPSGQLGPDTIVRSLRIRPPRTGMELVVEAFPGADGSWELVVGSRADGCAEPVVGVDRHSAARRARRDRRYGRRERVTRGGLRGGALIRLVFRPSTNATA
jgi:hypothetical protein